MVTNKTSFMSACDAAARIASGRLTAEALVRMCLDRIEERDGLVGAWEYLDPNKVLAEAQRLDREPRRGPLHGIPIGVKDVIDTADMPTSYGSPIYRDHRPARDAACVALARAAGAIVLGKTVTTEFAYFTPGKTANPHSLNHTPGGSSSGSAAAVADGMVPLAFGTQTAGSVIRPAAFCGVVGYKPSFGLISRAGMWSFAESLDTVGVFARNVPDAALLAAVASRRPAMQTRADVMQPPRLGICPTDNWLLAAPETMKTLENTADQLSMAGVCVSEIVLPKSFSDLTEAHATIMAFEAAHSFAYERTNHQAEISPTLSDLVEIGLACSTEEYDAAIKLASACRQELDAVFSTNDALLTPSTIGIAPAGLSATGDPLFNRMWTLLHVPCIHIPISTGPSDLPIGLQMVGRFRDDERLLAIAEWVARCLN